jgi:hypothetical protein
LDGDAEIHGAGSTVTALPASHLIGHWTRSLLASPDGSKLYVGIGSISNVGEYGLEAEAGRAAIWEIDVATGQHRVYASGLRNPWAWPGSRRPAPCGPLSMSAMAWAIICRPTT